jgi:hypothetical protein
MYIPSGLKDCISSDSSVVTIKLENSNNLIIRQPARANQPAFQLYTALNFKQSNPDMRKKSIVPHN